MARRDRRLIPTVIGFPACDAEGVGSEIPITGDTIRLGQLLKLAGVVGSGSEVKDLLASEHVLVNGEPEDRRGRQLHAGDVVRVGEEELHVIGAS
jgi:ribosome-associated protein